MKRWVVSSILLLSLLGCAAQNRPALLIGATGPVYPLEAKAQGVEGYVTVGYDISVEGQVINLVVLESNPPGVFDDAAITAVSKWRFNPQIEDGEPVAALRKESTVTFKLTGSEAYDQY